MKVNLIVFCALFFWVSTIHGQTISVINDDGLKYTDISDTKTKNQTYTLHSRPPILTIRVNGAAAFTTSVNDGAKPAITATPGNSKAGTALFTFVPGSATTGGTFKVGTATDGSNFIQIKTIFQSSGYYTIASEAKNGIMFYATGYSDGAGQKDIQLKAMGTPAEAGNISFNLSNGSTVPITINAGQAATAGAANALTFGATAGTFTVGKETDESNTITLKATVTTAGYYDITTAVVNGIFFRGTGKFDGTGTKTITLNAYGIPNTSGTKKMKFEMPGGINVQQDVTIAAADPDIFTYSIPNDVTKVVFSPPTGTDSYTIQIPPASNGVNGDQSPPSANGSAYEDYIYTKYGKENLKITPYGLLVNTKIDNQTYLYGGPNYIHIFLDELGNSLITTIPQGIPEVQYVVHVIYSATNNEKKVAYGVKPTRATFLGGNRVEGGSGNGELNSTSDNQLLEYTVVIKTSDSNIDFDVYRFENGAQKSKLSYTITMTNAFSTSISVGLLNTKLHNPTYSLVNDPGNPNLKVAKQTEGNDRGFGTVFATLYTSPITIIKYYLDRKKIANGDLMSVNNPVADFQLHSKDYLYMRPVWERIYPTLGVGLNDKIFQNLFFGFNWEFARGGSLFLGGHYGRVNVFNAPKGFQFQKDNITQDQFDLYQNIDWKVGWAFGASVDFKIIGNLFK